MLLAGGQRRDVTMFRDPSSVHSIIASGDRSLNVITLFCCCGLAATFSVLAFGVNLTDFI